MLQEACGLAQLRGPVGAEQVCDRAKVGSTCPWPMHEPRLWPETMGKGSVQTREGKGVYQDFGFSSASEHYGPSLFSFGNIRATIRVPREGP